MNYVYEFCARILCSSAGQGSRAGQLAKAGQGSTAGQGKGVVQGEPYSYAYDGMQEQENRAEEGRAQARMDDDEKLRLYTRGN